MYTHTYIYIIYIYRERETFSSADSRTALVEVLEVELALLLKHRTRHVGARCYQVGSLKKKKKGNATRVRPREFPTLNCC